MVMVMREINNKLIDILLFWRCYALFTEIFYSVSGKKENIFWTFSSKINCFVALKIIQGQSI